MSRDSSKASAATPSASIPSASLWESLAFTALVVVPNVIQGLFRRRPGRVALATRLNLDGRAMRRVAKLRDRYGPGPVWVRVLKDRMLLVLSPEDIHRVLAGSPEPFASDPPAKKQGMSHFQPEALTISRGEAWRNRRRFHEAVLDTGNPVHRLAAHFVALAREEMAPLGALPELTWESFHRAFQRITRRGVLGEAARDDEEITRRLGILMEEANGRPSEPPEDSESYRTFQARLETYVRSGTGEPGTSQGLVGLFGQAPSDAETRVTGQIAHWLFALGDTLAVNTFRALALLASHPRQRERAQTDPAWLEGCLLEAMRLWPTTPILSRITVEEVSWNEGDPGWRIPAGTQVLIVNTFHHRDRRRFDFADRLAPEIWSRDTGAAVEDPATRYSFNFFSHGPQGCPGRELALLVGTTVLATWLEHRPHPPRLIHPRLDPDRPLPSMLDPYRLRYSLQEDPP